MKLSCLSHLAITLSALTVSIATPVPDPLRLAVIVEEDTEHIATTPQMSFQGVSPDTSDAESFRPKPFDEPNIASKFFFEFAVVFLASYSKLPGH